MNDLFGNLDDIPSKIIHFFGDIIDVIASVLEALKTFYLMLEEFDNTIVAMTDSCGSSEFVGMPILDSIGMIRYLVGDIVFYMMYAGILFGCLFAVYKLIVLLFEALEGLVMQVSGVSCKAYFGSLVNKLFK